MAREPPTADSMYGPSCAPACVSPYPYGLRLNLTQEELEKLGYTSLPPAGTEVHLEAVGCVVRSSSEDPDCDGDVDYLCVEVQITQLGVAEGGKDKDEDAPAKVPGAAAEKLYGKGKQAA